MCIFIYYIYIYIYIYTYTYAETPTRIATCRACSSPEFGWRAIRSSIVDSTSSES